MQIAAYPDRLVSEKTPSRQFMNKLRRQMRLISSEGIMEEKF
jgi:hypothetical protein